MNELKKKINYTVVCVNYFSNGSIYITGKNNLAGKRVFQRSVI